jgi:hypothetical protein
MWHIKSPTAEIVIETIESFAGAAGFCALKVLLVKDENIPVFPANRKYDAGNMRRTKMVYQILFLYALYITESVKQI